MRKPLQACFHLAFITSESLLQLLLEHVGALTACNAAAHKHI